VNQVNTRVWLPFNKKTPIKLLKEGRQTKLGLYNVLLGYMTQYPGPTELQGCSRPLPPGLTNTEA